MVTGGSGFIGRRLVAALTSDARQVDVYSGDIGQFNTLTQRYSVVYHLAGITRTEASQPITALFTTNVSGTRSVLQYCRRVGARCIITSSAAVYRPLRVAGRLDENAPLDPPSLYGISKLLAEQLCADHAEQQQLPTTILRIFNPYGPRQPASFLIPYLIAQLATGQPLMLQTPGVVRDFVHIADVVNALRLCGEREEPGLRIFNVGTGVGMSVREVAARIAQQIGIRPTIEEREAGINYVVADIQKIHDQLGWQPQYGFDDGVGLLLHELQQA